MPLVNDYRQVKEIYEQAAELRIALPAFCAEDRETLEAILAAAYELGCEIGIDSLPIVPAWTSRYPGRGQMKLVTASGEPRLGVNLMLSDIKAFMGDSSPYRNLLVMPHLDHAFPWLDGDILDDFADDFASVMYDASEKPFDENIKLTAGYVEKVKGRVLIEGAVDEIFESGGKGEKNQPTTPEQAKKFLAETGVDIIVPNVGTEHRSTVDKARYLSGTARQISAEVGKILCLHGTSSVDPGELHKLPGDGFVKINIYTILAVSGGQSLAKQVIENLGNVFDEKTLAEMVEKGILGKSVLSPDYANTQQVIKPKLDYVTNPKRRDAWFKTVKNRCKDFMEIFNYKRFAK